MAERKTPLWEKAVIAFLREQNEAVDGRRIISDTRMLRQPNRRLASARNCPSLYQIAEWGNKHEDVEVFLGKRHGLLGNITSVNFYEWIGA